MSKYNVGVLAGAFLVSWSVDKGFLRGLALIIGIGLLIECWGRE